MKTKRIPITVKETISISADVWLEGKEAEMKLQLRCIREKMSRTEVILKWGDPRKWK